MYSRYYFSNALLYVKMLWRTRGLGERQKRLPTSPIGLFYFINNTASTDCGEFKTSCLHRCKNIRIQFYDVRIDFVLRSYNTRILYAWHFCLLGGSRRRRFFFFLLPSNSFFLSIISDPFKYEQHVSRGSEGRYGGPDHLCRRFFLMSSMSINKNVVAPEHGRFYAPHTARAS